MTDLPMTFEQAMKLAVALYANGEPVVLTDSNAVLHGGQELASLGRERCRIIPIDKVEWDRQEQNWQAILRSARDVWLKNHS